MGFAELRRECGVLRPIGSSKAIIEIRNRGDKVRVEGIITGPNGRELAVVTIWLRWYLDGTFHFVTLKPYRGENDAD